MQLIRSYRKIKFWARRPIIKRRIDFIIAGVQKGGTTALHTFLSQHPQIFLPQRKELHFFDNERLKWSCPDYTSLH